MNGSGIYSIRLDTDTDAMLKDIVTYKGFDTGAQAVRFLIKKYHKKKFGGQGFNCQSCANFSEITNIVPEGTTTGQYCCCMAHVIDDKCNATKCGSYERKE